MLIGLIGFIGSGKDTAGDILASMGWKRDGFAKPLKDAVAAIFGWDRVKLDGHTKEDREWRERKDEYWSKALGKTVTPRLALQWMGTEAGRNVFGEDLWTASCLKRIQDDSKNNYVVTDVRFNNEIEAINKAGGYLIRISRGEQPPYYFDAVFWNTCYKNIGRDLPESLKNVHLSEYDWIGNPLIDFNVDNNGTLKELESTIGEIVKRIKYNETESEFYRDTW